MKTSFTKSNQAGSAPAPLFQYAKRIALSAPGKFLLAVAVLISLMSIPLLTKADGPNEKRTLTGNWMVTVTRVNPPPGVAPTFLSLMTFFNDGNFLEENNTTSINSTRRGNWERIGHQQFTRSFIGFRFDATRNYLGTVQVTATVALNEDGNEFQADAVILTYDTSGNLLSTRQSTEVGQRF